MQTIDRSRVTSGIALIYTSYVVMLSGLGSFIMGIYEQSPIFALALTGMMVGLLIEAVGLFKVWQGLGTAPNQSTPKRLLLAALLVVGWTAVSGGYSLLTYFLGFIEVVMYVGRDAIRWQFVCFGLTLLACVRMAVSFGHRFKRGGEEMLTTAAIGVAVAPFLPLGHVGELLPMAFCLGQPVFGLILWLFRSSLPAASSAPGVSEA